MNPKNLDPKKLNLRPSTPSTLHKNQEKAPKTKNDSTPTILGSIVEQNLNKKVSGQLEKSKSKETPKIKEIKKIKKNETKPTLGIVPETKEEKLKIQPEKKEIQTEIERIQTALNERIKEIHLLKGIVNRKKKDFETLETILKQSVAQNEFLLGILSQRTKESEKLLEAYVEMMNKKESKIQLIIKEMKIKEGNPTEESLNLKESEKQREGNSTMKESEKISDPFEGNFKVNLKRSECDDFESNSKPQKKQKMESNLELLEMEMMENCVANFLLQLSESK
jgi:hypothetical protein